MNNALITGTSRGLGRGIAEEFLARGYRIYGLSRSGEAFAEQVKHENCDLTDFQKIPACLDQLLDGVENLQVVILNAGILGDIKPMQENSVDELHRIMDINVWSNKVILDYLLNSPIKVDQVLLMSSGAAVLGNKGWGGYALSKAALNMLGKLYAHEFSNTHICAIAPGLIDTDMMTYLTDNADSNAFPALKRLKAARGTEAMQSPRQAGQRIFEALKPLRGFESGSFVDLRQIFAPEQYAELMKNWSKANQPS